MDLCFLHFIGTQDDTNVQTSSLARRKYVRLPATCIIAPSCDHNFLSLIRCRTLKNALRSLILTVKWSKSITVHPSLCIVPHWLPHLTLMEFLANAFPFGVGFLCAAVE